MRAFFNLQFLLSLGFVMMIDNQNAIAAGGDSPASADKPAHEYAICKTLAPIKIDGIPDEKSWNEADLLPAFAEIETGEPARYPVSAKMLWDDKCLYIAFWIADPNVWSLNALRDFPMAGSQLPLSFMMKARDFKETSSYTENSVNVYIDPDNDGRNYLEMHVNPRNAVCDKWQETPWSKAVCKRMGIAYPEKTEIHPLWNCPGLKTATHIDGTLNDPYDVDRGWTAEIAIPFESLKHLAPTQNFPPKSGDTWRLLLARRYASCPSGDAAYWTWPSIGEKSCHAPDRWGHATFMETNPSGTHEEINLAAIDAAAKEEPKALKDIPKGDFKWKALWSSTVKNKAEADDLIKLTKAMNCNVIIIYAEGSGIAAYSSEFLDKAKDIESGTLEYLISHAHMNNMKIHAWAVNLRVSSEFAKRQPEFLQKARDLEDENAKLPSVDPGRANAHTGSWLCPDQGLTEYERNVLCEMFMKFDFDGLALDYVGYRNYYACFCDHSIQKRQEFADRHPELSSVEILRQFSEDALVSYVTEVRNAVKTIKPNAEFSIHIYPDFDLNPAYANRLPVEYCGQTIAWFYKPFWSYGKVYDTCMGYKAAEGKFMDYNKFVPFVGVYPDDKLKSAERLRKEIRIAALSGNGTIMLAFAETFMKHSELAEIVAQELSSDAK